MQRKWRIAIVAVLVLALAGAGLWAGLSRKGSQAVGTPLGGGMATEVTLTPVKADPTGVDVAAGFLLKATKPMEADEVEKALTVQPAAAIKVEARNSKEFLVKPAAALQGNRVYRFQLAPQAGVSRAYNWSFQTRGAFRVAGSLPRHQGAGVPVNTGIELIFSHDDYDDVSPYFQISPKVEGSFERHKKTLAFVPKDPLQPGTIYTVTLKKGLAQTQGEGKLADDFTFTFETAPEGSKGSGGRQALHMPEDMGEFPAGQAPYFQLWVDASGPELDVTAYRYKDAASFAAALVRQDGVPWWASYARMRYWEDATALEKAASFRTKLVTYDNYSGSYLHFPEALPAGYYLAEVAMGQEKRQVRFQVTDLSSYVSVTSTKTLVWLNDLATGAPVEGAQVTLPATNETVPTDATGVAVLSTPPGSMNSQNQAGLYLLARAGNKETVVAAPYRSYYWHGENERARSVLYWKYLYTDRGLYKPSDTVHLWGILRPREKGAAPVEQVTARVTRGDYYGPDQKPLALAETTIPVTDGTFTGKLDLPGLKPGWYEVALYAGSDLMTTRYFEVLNYTKPAYKLEVKSDKRAVFSGDPVTFSMQASFFEGTPVPGLALSFSGSSGSGELTTDDLGRAANTFRPTSSYNPEHAWYSVRAALPESGEISDSTLVMVYSSDVLLQAGSQVVEANKTVISGKVNAVSLTGINAGDTWDVTGPPVADRLVKATVTEENWIKVERGTYYDFIQKTTHKIYDYTPNHKVIGTYSATTGADGTYRMELPIDPEKSYTVKVEVQGKTLGGATRDLYVSGRRYQGFYDSIYWGRWTHLTPTVEGRWEWKLGEPVTLEMRRDRAPTAERQRGYLFYIARLGLQSYKVQDSGRFTYALTPADAPSTTVTGVYFDGRSYTEARETTLRMDPQERAMSVAITTDKESYKPGETVKVSVAVTGPDGKPVRAQVNLNLVDEALYALQEQRVDLLRTLYGEYMPSGILRTRWTHQLPKPGGGAEKGGDGGGARKDFKDAIFFSSVATDTNGKATANFKVPDNLTTWRLTYHALSPDTMRAASGTTGVKVSLPFFVETVQSETYLVGDKPSISARTYGTALTTGQQVRLSGSLQGPVSQGTAPKDAKAFEVAGFSLPKLDKAGTYTMTVSAEGPGGLKDAVEKPMTVVDSYLRQKKVEFRLLEPGAKVKGPDEGVATLMLADYHRGRFLQLLGSLRWQWGNRFEQKLSRSAAFDLLKPYTDMGGQMMAMEPELDTMAYQAPDGGISILPYADSDLHLSALAADLRPDGFDRAGLEGYFTKVLEDDQAGREEKILALYGMAAIGQPVLLEAQKLLALQDLSLMEKFYLALAVAELGDKEGARPLYRSILTEHGEQLGADARIKTGRDRDEILRHTALAGMLAAKLSEPEGPAFAGYLMGDWGTDILMVLEEAIMAADGLATAPTEPVAVSYVADGKSVTRELKPGEVQWLTVTAKTLSTMEFREVKGKVGLTAVYEAPLGRADLKKREGFSVKRSYSVNGKETTTFKPGDLVKVTLTYTIPSTAPSGSYELTDYLPSGLKMLQKPWQAGVRWDKLQGWPLEANGQKTTFWASRDDKYKTITYYARVVTAGEYTAEEPVLQHGQSGILYAFGGRTKVVIK